MPRDASPHPHRQPALSLVSGIGKPLARHSVGSSYWTCPCHLLRRRLSRITPALRAPGLQCGMTPDNSLSLPIEGMTCASCSARVERALQRVPGVQQVSVNLATESAAVELSSAGQRSHAERGGAQGRLRGAAGRGRTADRRHDLRHLRGPRREGAEVGARRARGQRQPGHVGGARAAPGRHGAHRRHCCRRCAVPATRPQDASAADAAPGRRAQEP